jgi:GNAT superfamily N-acetyltransferase
MTGLQVQDAAAFSVRLPELLEVYRAAFLEIHEPDPARAAAERSGLMRQHAQRPGLRLVTATDCDGQLQGFCYSYHGHRGQWWHDVIVEALGPTEAQEWLGDCREVVELHVLPAAQGAGLGRQLLRGALTGVPERTCLLSALELPESRARRLYASEGFHPLLSQFRFPGSPTPYAILGKVLPAGEPAPPS